MAETSEGVFYLDSVRTGQYPSVYWQLICHPNKNWELICNKFGGGSFSGGSFTVTIMLSSGVSQTLIVEPPLHNYDYDYVSVNTQIPPQSGVVGVVVTVSTVNYESNYNTTFNGIYEPPAPDSETFSINAVTVEETSNANFSWEFKVTMEVIQDEFTTLKNGLTLAIGDIVFNEVVESRKSSRSVYNVTLFKYRYELRFTGNNVSKIKAFYATVPNASSTNRFANISMYSVFKKNSTTSIETLHTRNELVTIQILTPPPSFLSGWYTVALDNSTSGGDPDFAYYIRGKSRAAVTLKTSRINITDLCGATITAFKIGANNKTFTISSPTDPASMKTDIYTVAGDKTIKIYAVDSRGKQYLGATVALTVYPYSNPTLSGDTVYRCDEHGVQDSSGGYIYIKTKASCSPVKDSNNVSHNSVTIQARYRPSSGDYGEPITITSNVGVIVGDGLVDPDSAYYVEIVAIDTAGFATTIVDFIQAKHKTVHIKNGGRAVGIGMVVSNEDDDTFHVAYDTYLYGTLTMGSTTIKENQLQQLLALIGS